MSDATVRAQIQSFFNAAEINGVQKIYQDAPWFINGSEWNLETNLGWGAICYIHLDTANETRYALPAITGQKRVDHVVSMVIMYQYLIPATLPVGTIEDAWVGPLDTIIESIKSALRGSPNLGNATVIFQAGQGEQDIKQERELPTLNKGRIWSWSRIEFQVTETIVA